MADPRPDQDETVFSQWLGQGEALREVYFTWLPRATLGVDLVAPAVWLYSTLPPQEIRDFLLLASDVKERFMPDLPNVPAGRRGGKPGHARAPFYTTEVQPGPSET